MMNPKTNELDIYVFFYINILKIKFNDDHFYDVQNSCIYFISIVVKQLEEITYIQFFLNNINIGHYI
jgi:hypothetical protein